MFLDLINICDRYGLRFELIPYPPSTGYIGCTIRLTSRDGIRINRDVDKHMLQIIRDDPDEHVLKCIIPEIINDIERCRKEIKCV